MDAILRTTTPARKPDLAPNIGNWKDRDDVALADLVDDLPVDPEPRRSGTKKTPIALDARSGAEQVGPAPDARLADVVELERLVAERKRLQDAVNDRGDGTSTFVAIPPSTRELELRGSDSPGAIPPTLLDNPDAAPQPARD